MFTFTTFYIDFVVLFRLRNSTLKKYCQVGDKKRNYMKKKTSQYQRNQGIFRVFLL